MLSLTLRLAGRSLHLVRELRECDSCNNKAAHVRVPPGVFLKSEVAGAAQRNAMSLADLREIAAKYGFLNDVHRVHDARLLAYIEWLLDTERLIAVQCVKVLDFGPVSAGPATAPPPMPRRRVPTVSEVKTWVEIELKDDNGKPVPGQAYRIKIPGGIVEEGRLDAKGRARIDNIDPGTCEISFPDIDAKEWKRA